nr:allo60 [Herpesvirus DDDp]
MDRVCRKLERKLFKYSPFLLGTWKLMDGSKTAGITKIIDSLTTNRNLYSTGNALKKITLDGLAAYESIVLKIVKSDESCAQVAKVDYFTLGNNVYMFAFLPREIGVDLLRAMVSKGAAVAWRTEEVHLLVGNTVDRLMKLIFQRKRPVVPAAVNLLAEDVCKVLSIKPVWADVRVASHGEPFVGSKGGAALHPCAACEAEPSDAVRSVTAVDLIGATAGGKIVLVELKTYKGCVVSADALKRYTVQAWLTWLLFAITYRKCIPLHMIDAKIVVLMPAICTVQYFNVSPPVLTAKLLARFPFAKFICKEKLKALAPGVARPKVKGPFAATYLPTGFTNYAPWSKRQRTFTRRSKKSPVLKTVAEYKQHPE